MNFFMSKAFVSVAGAIVVTGAALNLANSGKLGMTAKQIAQYITRGYGAGAL